MGSKIHKELAFITILNQEPDLRGSAEITIRSLLTTSRRPDLSELAFDLGLDDIQLDTTAESYIQVVEHEDKFLVLITPPSVKDEWSRYNNVVDYLENSSAETKIQYINQRLLPFWNPMMVSANGKILTDDESTRLSSGVCKQFAKTCHESLEAKGINFSKELKTQQHMQAPRVVYELASLVGKIKDQDLKLAIVTFWN